MKQLELTEETLASEAYSSSRCSPCRVVSVYMLVNSLRSRLLQIVSDTDVRPYSGAKLSKVFSLGLPKHFHLAPPQTSQLLLGHSRI